MGEVQKISAGQIAWTDRDYTIASVPDILRDAIFLPTLHRWEVSHVPVLSLTAAGMVYVVNHPS